MDNREINYSFGENNKPVRGASVTVFFHGILPGGSEKEYTDDDGWETIRLTDSQRIIDSMYINHEQVDCSAAICDGDTRSYSI